VTQLRTLVEFSKLGTLAKVADSLGYTTGAISQQLSALEKRMGVPLLERVGRRSRLTPAGTLLVQYARRILALAQETETGVREIADAMAGTLRIGIFATSATHVVAPVTARMRELYPRLEVQLIEVPLEEVTLAVQRRDIDASLAINYSSAPIPRVEGLTLTSLTVEPFHLAVAADSPYGRDGRPGHLEEFVDAHWILTPGSTYFGQAIRAACRRHGFEPNVVHDVTDTVSSLSIVAAGLAVTPVTDLMAETFRGPGVRLVPVDHFFEREIVLVHSDESNRRATMEFIALLRQALN